MSNRLYSNSKQMLPSAYATSSKRPQRLFAESTTASQQSARELPAAMICVGMLMLVVTLLSGCQTLPTKPCETLPLPTAPASSEPQPSPSHSKQWELLAESLRKKLTDTPMTHEPAVKPGLNK